MIQMGDKKTSCQVIHKTKALPRQKNKALSRDELLLRELAVRD